MSQNNIECPSCGHEIDVQDVLYHQVEEQLNQKFQQDKKASEEQVKARLEELAAKEQALKEAQAKQVEAIESSVKEKLNQERQKLRSQLQEEQQEQYKLLQEELNSKSEQLKEFNKAKADIERLKREKDEIKGKVEAEAERKLSETISSEKAKIQQEANEKASMKVLESENVINQLKEQLKEAQRKAEQGSMQIQGEVQEVAIEQWLEKNFPLDTVDEIKKGARGADCLQIINTHSRENCGSIYYESKRTKAFQPSWIEKFKEDIRSKGANIGVLVTEAMPSDMKRASLREGIWICTFEEFKTLSFVLRENLISITNAIATQENKGDKMVMLYDFLTGNEFRMQVEAIVEGFSQMQEDLNKERRSMESMWKKREKQIQKVLLNTNHMYSSIKGIAGNSVQSVPLLELEED